MLSTGQALQGAVSMFDCIKWRLTADGARGGGRVHVTTQWSRSCQRSVTPSCVVTEEEERLCKEPRAPPWGVRLCWAEKTFMVERGCFQPLKLQPTALL